MKFFGRRKFENDMDVELRFHIDAYVEDLIRSGLDRVEAERVVSVGRTKWTVCYKVHVIPSRRIEYKTSITLWPRTRQNRARLGWHPHLVKSNWYQACLRELRRYGYHGNWLSSPYGRFGDFWKTLRDFSALARETRFLERLRKESRLSRGRRTSRLSGLA